MVVEQIKEIEFEMAQTQKKKATGMCDPLPYPNGMQQLRTEMKPCNGISHSSIYKEFLSKILVF
jgi:ribosome-interacting GTPase 1